MQTELTVLVLGGFLHLAQMALASYYMAREPGGREYNLTPRDADRRPGIKEGRATRAVENLDANLVVFAIAAVVVAMTDGGGWWTALLSWLWLGLRVLYVPAYVQGWVPWRSAIFAGSALCLAFLLLAALV